MMLRNGLATGHAEAHARMGANARAMFEAEYSQAMAMGKWRAVLSDVQGK